MTRQLDAQVAEAMGHQHGPCLFDEEDIKRSIETATWYCEKCGHEGSVDRLWRWTEYEHDIFIPHYSTDISAAWGLVEAANLLVSPTLMLSNGRQWIAGKFKGVTGDGKRYCDPDTVVQANTAPEAICLAFLRAMGREVAGEYSCSVEAGESGSE